MGCAPISKDIKIASKTKVKSDYAINICNSNEKESTNTYKSNDDIHSIKRNTVDMNYSIIQKFNTKIKNSYKVMSKVKQEICVMKIIQIKFVNEINNLIKTPINRMIKIIALYEDNVNFYMITEYFEGNHIFEFVNIESKMYNQKCIAKIIFNLIALSKDLKSNGVHKLYLSPNNIFCHYSEQKQFKLQVFFNSDLDIDDEYILNQTNFLYTMLFSVIKDSNNIQWQIGVIMFNLIYGTTSYISEIKEHKELYKDMMNYIEENQIEDISKKVLKTLLNNKELKSSLEKEYFTKSKNNCKEFNLFNEIETEKLDRLFTSFKNYHFISKHY